MNPYTGKCEHFYSSLDDTTISDNCIKHLYKDSHDNIWIGTTKGLEMYNPDTNDFSRIYTHGAVTWIVEDSFGNLCFANDKDGFFTYNIVSGLITNYPLNSNDKIYTLFEDSNKRLWAGMWSSGLKLFNRKTGHFDSVDLRYVHDDSFNHEQIGYIIELGTGNLLLASRGGLIVFDPKSNSASHIGIRSNKI
ncbi:two-component regulator propeller domain-containing protein [Bacteroides sp. CR5/BHMF/2]|nr:two-component regulator propeller domain-containing protein [Bacteroides sp. CR5/BHMF/2]